MNNYKIQIEKKIRRILRRTDWIVYNVENIFTTEQVEEAKVYRQALRDMNDNNIDSNQWVFPELPSFINYLDLEE